MCRFILRHNLWCLIPLNCFPSLAHMHFLLVGWRQGPKWTWFFVFWDLDRCEIKLGTKMKINPKYKDQKCIFAFFSSSIFLLCLHIISWNSFNCRVMLQPQTILQYFYKQLMWSAFYWFSSRPTINIVFSFTNNYSPHQQFVNIFVKMFVSLALFFIVLTSA